MKMSLNDIKFIRGNGGMGRQSASEDPISGLIMAFPNYPEILAAGITAGLFSEVEIESSDKSIFIAKLDYYQQLEDMDIKATDIDYENIDNKQVIKNVINYHVREFFRMSETGKLWLGIVMGETEPVMVPGVAITLLQNKAEGKIRQIGVFTPDFSQIPNYQTAAAGNGVTTGLEQNHRPLSIIVTAKGNSLELAAMKQTNEFLSDGRKNVSMLISCDLDNDVLAELGEELYGYYGCIGNCLGAVSAASVNECIAWVAKFPLGLSKPGFITGELITEVNDGVLGLLNENRYIFIRLIEGAAGNFYNDSHTLDAATSDYAYIENVRTMDKAVREIRKKIVPFLNSPIKVDAASGKLNLAFVTSLTNECNNALSDMTRAGELSGYQCEIDPEQNVLSTSEIEIIIKNVPVGVVRNMKIKIGYTNKIN